MDEDLAAGIRRQIDDGNLWAWCTVRVSATDGDAKGYAYLGTVSYWMGVQSPTYDDLVRAFMADCGRDMLAEAIAEYQQDRARLAAKYCMAGTA